MSDDTSKAAGAAEALDRVIRLLSDNGCDCDCGHDAEGHDAEGHDDDCERCFPCRVEAAIRGTP